MTNQKPASELETHIGYWLRFVSNHVSHAFQAKVEVRGVTVAEWVVLRTLLRTGAVAPMRSGRRDRADARCRFQTCRPTLRETTRRSHVRDKRIVATNRSGSRRRENGSCRLSRLADENDREFVGHLATARCAELVLLLQDCVRHHGWKDLPVE